MMNSNTIRGYYLKCLWVNLFFWLTFSLASAQLTIRITSWPTSPASPDIYLAGNFNGWNPGLTAYQLKKDAEGVYTLTFQPSVSAMEFKFTRGSWASVETNASGGDIPNRKFNYTGGPATLNLTIAGWAGSQPSTASPNVSLLDDDFPIKSLNRTRRIWLYLPPDYLSQTEKKYPVIYMLDGQNVFDKATSFSGEWRVDESLDQLFQQGDPGCIVVAIANGESQRINEYAPWINAQYGGGEGEKFLKFLTDELKPYIDQHYRTKTEAEHTAIMGSSMGGLFSFYAGFERPDIFGRIAPMSTSFWFAPVVFNWIKDKVPPAQALKVYLTVGANEGGSQQSDMLRMYNLILEEGIPVQDIKADSDANEGHNESYWSKKFPTVYKWLMATGTVNTTEAISTVSPRIHCVDTTCFYRGPACSDCDIAIFDISGQLIARKKMDENGAFTVPDLRLGVFQLYKNQQLIYTEKIVPSR